MVHESKARSLIKAVSWRIMATITTAAIVYFMTGDFSVALAVGSIEVVAKFLLYYIHERIWTHVSFGIR